MNYEDYKKIYEVEGIMEYRKWVVEIPFIKFPSDWEVQVIPPFGGAVARFSVKKGDKQVSIYLDCYDKLGIYGEPYWEIYPYEDDVFRCAMKDTESLLKAISETLNSSL